MGIIWDIVKEIPQAAILKEKIADMDARMGGLETKASMLESDLRKANIKINELTDENKRLKDQIKTLSASEDSLDPIALDILKFFIQHSELPVMPKLYILNDMPGDTITLSYHIDELIELGYLESVGNTGGGLNLTKKGKRYCMDNP